MMEKMADIERKGFKKMNNYMQKIADMLGVELGEVFYIKQGEHNIKFILSKDGLHQVVCIDGKETCGILSHRIFGKILTGEAKIIKRPWKPSNLECYYKVKKWDNGEISIDMCTWFGFGTSGNLIDWKIGNCFRTKEEAEKTGKYIIEQLESEFRKA